MKYFWLKVVYRGGEEGGDKRTALLGSCRNTENTDWLQSDRTHYIKNKTWTQQIFTAVINQRQDGWMFTVVNVHSPATLLGYVNLIKWLSSTCTASR